jgi:hypothetical protein
MCSNRGRPQAGPGAIQLPENAETKSSADLPIDRMRAVRSNGMAGLHLFKGE